MFACTFTGDSPLPCLLRVVQFEDPSLLPFNLHALMYELLCFYSCVVVLIL